MLETIHEYLPQLLQAFDNQAALTEIRRAFHTLKGSGRMVGASVVGELAWSIENVLNRVLDGSIFMNDDIASVLFDVVAVLPALVSDFEHRRGASVDTQPLMARADALARGEVAAVPQPMEAPQDEAVGEQELLADDDSELPGLDLEEVDFAAGDDFAEHDEALALDMDALPDVTAEDAIDPALLDIFRSEAETHLQALQAFIDEARGQDRYPFSDSLTRALHTLKGSAHTAGIDAIAAVVAPLEKFVKSARAENMQAQPEFIELLERAAQFVADGLSQSVNDQPQPLTGTDAFLDDLAALSDRTFGTAEDSEQRPASRPDPQIIQLFLSEGMDIILDADSILEAWSRATQDDNRLSQLSLELRRLARGAEEAGLHDVAEIADTLETAYELARRQSEQPEPAFFEVARRGHEALINMMDQIAAGLATKPDNALLAELREHIGDLEEALAPKPLPPEMADDLDAIDRAFDEDLELTGLPEDEATADLMPPVAELSEAGEDDNALDAEVVEIFLEEASDLIAQTSTQLQQWLDNPEQNDHLRQLQRDLHTLKGGARLAEIAAIGDLAHEMETLFEGLLEQRLNHDSELGDLLLRGHDRLAVMVEAIAEDSPSRPAPDLIAELREYAQSHRASAAPTPVSPAPEKAAEDEPALPTEPQAETELAQAREEAPEAPQDHSETHERHALDDELAEIFLEEAGDIIDTTSDLLHRWQADTDDLDLLKSLQRELHTLKGGARMAEIAPIADLAHEMETLFERMVEGRLTPQPEHASLALRCHDQLATLVEAVAEGGQCPPATELVDALRTVLRGEGAPEVSEPASETPPAALAEDREEQSFGALDPELVGIFLEEAYDLINSTASLLHAWTEEPDNRELAANLQRDLHTLKGGARMAEVAAIGDLAHQLEDLFERLADGRLAATAAMNDLLFACHDRLAQMVEQVAAHKPCPPARELEQQVADTLRGEPVAEAHRSQPATAATPADDDLVEIFLDEAREIQAALREALEQWRDEPGSLDGVTQLQNELHTLKGGARLADLDMIADLAQAWDDRLQQAFTATGDPSELVRLSDDGLGALDTMLDSLEQGQRPAVATGLLQRLGADTGTEPAADGQNNVAQTDEVDAEVLEIFLEEAGDLSDSLDNILAEWRQQPEAGTFNQDAQRILHTLKGGARLAQLPPLGDEAHAFETRLTELQQSGQAPDEAAWNDINAFHDRLISLISGVREQYDALARGETPAPLPAVEAPPEAAPAPEAEPPAEAPTPVPAEKPVQRPPQRKKPKDQRAQQESIRVNAPLLDELVNLAGETSITRGRLEQQTSDFSHTLDEMAATIERLREQLRRMDIETEAQILFRAERELGPNYDEEFDPAGNGPLFVHPAAVPGPERIRLGSGGPARDPGRPGARYRDAAGAAVTDQYRAAGRPDEDADDPVLIHGAAPAPDHPPDQRRTGQEGRVRSAQRRRGNGPQRPRAHDRAPGAHAA